jgi:hypothetical protein
MSMALLFPASGAHAVASPWPPHAGAVRGGLLGRVCDGPVRGEPAARCPPGRFWPGPAAAEAAGATDSAHAARASPPRPTPSPPPPRAPQPARAVTRANLASAGYGDRCPNASAPAAAGAAPAAAGECCYVDLILRPPGDDRLASVYKPWARKQLQARGFELLGSIGDQFSDLGGRRGGAAGRWGWDSGRGRGWGWGTNGCALRSKAATALRRQPRPRASSPRPPQPSAGEASAAYNFKLPNPFYFIL